MRKRTPTLDPVSNLETWTETLSVFESTDGLPFFTVADPPSAVTLKLRDMQTDATVLSGSLADGALVVVDSGEIEFTFSADAMSALEPKIYEVGCLYTDEGITRQMILGHLPVLRGL